MFALSEAGEKKREIPNNVCLRVIFFIFLSEILSLFGTHNGEQIILVKQEVVFPESLIEKKIYKKVSIKGLRIEIRAWMQLNG